MDRRVLLALLLILSASRATGLEPIPDRLVVLTFDDSSKTHFTVARPVLKKYAFGATFFITEGFDFPTNKRDYMSWAEIAQLHADGFEIGNHTRDHFMVTAANVSELAGQVRAINAQCKKHGIPTTVSFAYPGNAIHKSALPILKELDIKFARRGGSPEYPYKEGRGFAYEPGLDHPLLMPSAGDARPAWKMDDFKRAVGQARHGKIVVLQFHGVPDTAHDWVTTSRKQFEEYMKYLADQRFKVIAMRDLSRYVDPNVAPVDAWGVIEDRERLLQKKQSPDNSRKVNEDAQLRYWLKNMVAHRFTVYEMAAALGQRPDEVTIVLRRLRIDPSRQEKRPADAPVLVLPYPGGRHPRIGYLDGAIRPQRETKISVFAPWRDGGYAVADVPEAIWFDQGGKSQLLYLAHTHIPTVWDRRGLSLPALEWNRKGNGTLEIERTLPNKVAFGAQVLPASDGVRMVLWVRSGSAETLKGLLVQMCVMLKKLGGFDEQTNENKVFTKPFAACRDQTGKRWVITGWQPCVRTWGNPPCPCLHSDPQVPDCSPGQTKKIVGWLSFYEGKDIEGEMRRLRKTVFEVKEKAER
jgi:peptidoglycan/xylan/chitin deacetylase (PgdA/CDA1 family)